VYPRHPVGVRGVYCEVDHFNGKASLVCRGVSLLYALKYHVVKVAREGFYLPGKADLWRIVVSRAPQRLGGFISKTVLECYFKVIRAFLFTVHVQLVREFIYPFTVLHLLEHRLRSYYPGRLCRNHRISHLRYNGTAVFNPPVRQGNGAVFIGNSAFQIHWIIWRDDVAGNFIFVCNINNGDFAVYCDPEICDRFIVRRRH